MKLTIIKDDKAVYIDGFSYSNLNLNIPNEIHALQWENNTGWIEFAGHSKPNEKITTLPAWADDCVTEWQNAYDAKQKAIEEAKLQPNTNGTTEL